MKRHAWRLVAMLAIAFAALQASFALRIAAMAVVDPQSTTFQRSEAWRLAVEKHRIAWSQQWVDDAQLSSHLKRAVIASEDAGFAEHSGVEWDAIEKAWERNQRSEARAPATAKIVGGSTITQQLAKNLLLSGERTVLRKAQEFAITLMLEGLLRRVGRRPVRRAGGGAPLFPRRCGPPAARAGGAAGGDAAGPQALREAAGLGLRGRTRGHDRRAHARRAAAMNAPRHAHVPVALRVAPRVVR
jgi:hypothetical protein